MTTILAVAGVCMLMISGTLITCSVIIAQTRKDIRKAKRRAPIVIASRSSCGVCQNLLPVGMSGLCDACLEDERGV
jgi:hypothetical protein